MEPPDPQARWVYYNIELRLLHVQEIPYIVIGQACYQVNSGVCKSYSYANLSSLCFWIGKKARTAKLYSFTRDGERTTWRLVVVDLDLAYRTNLIRVSLYISDSNCISIFE